MFVRRRNEVGGGGGPHASRDWSMPWKDMIFLFDRSVREQMRKAVAGSGTPVVRVYGTERTGRDLDSKNASLYKRLDLFFYVGGGILRILGGGYRSSPNGRRSGMDGARANSAEKCCLFFFPTVSSLFLFHLHFHHVLLGSQRTPSPHLTHPKKDGPA